MYMYIHVTTRSKINKGFRITKLKNKVSKFHTNNFSSNFFQYIQKTSSVATKLA